MTKNELFEAEQNNLGLFTKLDKVISRYWQLYEPEDEKYSMNFFQPHQFFKDDNEIESSLEILENIGIAESVSGNSVIRGKAYKIKLSYRNSTPLVEQFTNWKQSQDNQNNATVINKTYSNSNVIEGSNIQSSKLDFKTEAAQKTNPPKENPKQNMAIGNKLIDKCLKFWWLIFIPIIVGIVLLAIEYKWFIKPAAE